MDIRTLASSCWAIKPVFYQSGDKSKNDYAYDIGSVDRCVYGSGH